MTLLTDIERGQVKIPQLQRDFVWSMQKSAALLDSIVKGYPVGAFIFWSTKDRLRGARCWRIFSGVARWAAAIRRPSRASLRRTCAGSTASSTASRPDYDWAIDISPEFLLNNGWFNTKRSSIKAILCLYAFHQPKSFSDNSVVSIRNYWLKQGNSKNYHDFFPRA